MRNFQELKDGEMCPCGSGKTYGECCKKKSFRYGISEGHLVRMIELTDEAEEVLDRERALFREYYGRDPMNKEYVFGFAPVYNDRSRVENVHFMQKQGLPEDKIYAYYKMDGILPSSETMDQYFTVCEMCKWIPGRSVEICYKSLDCLSQQFYTETFERAGNL